MEICKGIPVKYVRSGIPKKIAEVSDILSKAKQTMLDKILAGKKVVYIAPANDVLDVFTMLDDRMICPHFERLKLTSNGNNYSFGATSTNSGITLQMFWFKLSKGVFD